MTFETLFSLLNQFITEGVSALKRFAPEGVSAFLGALFAFIFMRFAERQKTESERRRLHIQSYVRLQFLLGDIATAIQSNEIQLEHFVEAHQKGQKEESLVLTPNRPHPIEFRDSVFDHLKNESLLNEILTYRVKVRQISEDIEALWSLHEKIRDSALNSSSALPLYYSNSRQCTEAAKIILIAGNELMNDTVHMLTKTRVLYKRDTRWFRKYLFTSISSCYPKRMDERVSAEKKQLHAEFTQTIKASAERIERMMKRFQSSG